MNVRILIAVMCVIGVGQKALAQAEIDRIAEELEQKGVECNKVVNRNPSTKKIVSEVRTYVFRSKDGNYARKLKKAFSAEEENSTTAITENGGRSMTLIFDTDGSHKVYRLEIGNESADPRVELNIIYNDSKVKVRRIFSRDFEGFDMQSFNEYMDKIGHRVDSFQIDAEKIRAEAEKWRERLREQQKRKLRTIADS